MQLAAMGAERYEVVLADSKSSRKYKRQWRPEELARSVAWLKRMNARGYNVFIAPAGKLRLVLIDGLNEISIRTLDKHGLNAAATIETEAGLFQAWVKICQHRLADDLREHAIENISRVIAELNGECCRLEFGRLAGFTRHATSFDPAAPSRYVVLRSADGAVARDAALQIKNDPMRSTTERQLSTQILKSRNSARSGRRSLS